MANAMNYDPNGREQGIPISKKQPAVSNRPAPAKPRAGQGKNSGGRKPEKGLPMIWKLLLGAAAVFVLTGVIVCGYIFFNVFSVAHGDVVIDLNEYQVNQNQTSIIYAYDTDGKLFELQRLHGKVNRIYVSINEMPKHLRQAFVSLEDKRFYEHQGVDWIRFVAVFVKDHFRTGGSSITQQLVKNITGERDATFVRKFNEIGYALNLENNFSKDQILEAYLNTLYLGEGCYGVKTAAEKYFGKEVSELNLAESACLASITKAPYGYDPLVNPENNRERQLDCLGYMKEQGKITEEEYKEAANYELIVLDEAVSAYGYGMLDREALLNLLHTEGQDREFVLTGRSPAPELIDIADYATEMRKEKHPFDRGIFARKGIEY